MSEADEFYDRAVELVLREKRPSVSFIQRSFALQYNIAANIMDRMQEEGIVSPINNAGKRRILVKS